MAPYQSKPLDHSLQIQELHYELNLYTDNHQESMVGGHGSNRYGEIDVNDWALIDPNQNGRTVGHAKGLRIQATQDPNYAARWHTSFDILFEAGSGLEGSTLQVMGLDVLSGEWSIVGGTGTLDMARGVIYKRNLGNRVELHIHALYIPMKRKRDSSDSREKNVWSW
uniref:Uncharacterized protein n=1 Tax=Avena sativa TaxID=4498 RepID=A0ACD5VAL6_AVESA